MSFLDIKLVKKELPPQWPFSTTGAVTCIKTLKELGELSLTDAKYAYDHQEWVRTTSDLIWAYEESLSSIHKVGYHIYYRVPEEAQHEQS